MKILFLAPQPFYQERGTPIAVRLALEVLAKRPNTEITLLTYHEGEDIPLPGVSFKRINAAFIKNVGPGISIKKLICDFIFGFEIIKLLWTNRKQQFELIHAVEESVFMALIVKFILGIPFVYDMDSSLSLQVYEKWSWCRPLLPFFRWLEAIAIKQSRAVVPVCFALYEIAERAGAKDAQILHDISLLDVNQSKDSFDINLRQEIGLAADATIALYIGNLEKYQGIDLLLESFATIITKTNSSSHLIIIGGQPEHIKNYQDLSQRLNIAKQTHLIGPRPVSALKALLLQADILLSPRTLGNNTPMKIYSYLHSGVPVVATELPTHTQVLNSDISILAKADPDSFGQALLAAFNNPELRKKIGAAAEKIAHEKYTFQVFSRDLNALYDRLVR